MDEFDRRRKGFDKFFALSEALRFKALSRRLPAREVISWIVVLATAARMALTAILAAKYGALGAAVSWAIGNVPLAIGLAIVCRRVCGLDPSVAAVLWRPRGEAAAWRRKLNALCRPADR